MVRRRVRLSHDGFLLAIAVIQNEPERRSSSREKTLLDNREGSWIKDRRSEYLTFQPQALQAFHPRRAIRRDKFPRLQ